MCASETTGLDGRQQMEGVKACIRELTSASETFAEIAQKFGDTAMGKAALARAQYYSDAAEHLALKFKLKTREGPPTPDP